MSLEKLAEKIDSAAKSEAEVVINNAKEQAKDIIDSAKNEAKEMENDVMDKMKEYSLGNLKHYNLSAEVACGDIEKINDYNFNAIVTDPPYGISAPTKGEGGDKLMKRSLDLLSNKLKSKQRLVIAVSKPELIYEHSLKIIKSFEWYIHKSLTRYIMIIEKN